MTPGDNINIDNNVISSSIGLPVLENQEININTFPVGAYIITGTDTVIKYGTNGLSSYKPITTNSSTGNTDSWILNITHGSGDESNRGFAFLFRRSGSSGGTAFYTFDFSGMNHVDISQLMTRNVNQSIYGRFDFYHALPTSSLVPSGDTELTNKKYVDDAVATKQDILTYSMYLPTGINVTDTEKLQVASDLINNLYKSGSNNSFILHNLYFDIYTGGSYDSNMFMNGVYPITNTKGTFKFMSINNSTTNENEPCVRGHILKIYGTWSNDVFTATRMLLTRSTHDLSLSNLNSSFLNRNNTTSYTPTADYNPSTKLYTDKTHYENMTGYDATKTQVLKNINGTLTWVNE